MKKTPEKTTGSCVLEFSPTGPDFYHLDTEYWSNVILFEIVRPLVKLPGVKRYWFARYCVPEYPEQKDSMMLKHVKLRVEFSHHSSVVLFINQAKILCKKHMRSYPYQAMELKVLPKYDFVRDLGAPRFFDTKEKRGGKKRRADIVFNYLHAISMLVLDCLAKEKIVDAPEPAGSNGFRYFVVENNNVQNSASKQMYESVFHLFGNITGFKVPILVGTIGNSVVMNTPVYGVRDVQYTGIAHLGF